MSEKLRINPIFLSGAIGEDAILGVSVATTGEAIGHHLVFDDTTLQQLRQLGASKSSGVKSRFTHPDWFHDGLGKYLGRVRNFRTEGEGTPANPTAGKLVGDLFISKTAHSSPAGDIGQYVLDLAREDPTALGVSVVVDLDRVWITTDGQELPTAGGRPAGATGKFPVARITALYAADLVDEPALNPNGLFQTSEEEYQEPLSQQGALAPCNSQQGALAPHSSQQGALAPHSSQQGAFAPHNSQQGALAPHSSQQGALAPCNTQQGEQQTMEEQAINERFTKLEANLAVLSKSIEDGIIQIGNQPPRGQQLSEGPAAAAQFQAYFEWLFGAPGAKLPPPELRRADALYRAVTGDVEMRGVFDPSHVAFAAANTTTLADLAVNAMNKVVIDLYTNLTAYRWYELITTVQATDGSLQDMQWLQFGGVGALPAVAEGAAYTELAVTDTKETGAFTKYGGYVGITDKMLRNSQIDRLQAIPRALTISAIRTRSAAIAAIFTQAAGLGPTMDQDSKALFVADNSHGNYATTAYSITAWKAARLECAKQAELGSAKRQVLWPKFVLLPVDLYDQALIDFGYGSGPGGYPGTPNNDTNIYAVDRPNDTRPVPIAVPEWTDTTDWAWIVDPKISPVICMAYGDNPGGTTHPAPQLYSVTDPTSGLLFTNDTLPIKVRDLFAYGVATYRGVGKRVVAGG